MLVGVGKRGTITTIGSTIFADFPVCRLDVTQLTDDSDTAAQTDQEAMALYGEMSGDTIVFDSNPLNLEPTSENIWARGVSLIAPNTFAYAYQRGTDHKIMMAVVHVNETTHRMKVVHQPSQIKDGFSPYVSMVSAPYTVSDPHTLTYYN